MPTVSRRVAERSPAVVRCEARPKTLGEQPQPANYFADPTLARVVDRPPSKRSESGAEDDPGVQEIGIGNDTFVQAGDSFVDQRQQKPVG